MLYNNKQLEGDVMGKIIRLNSIARPVIFGDRKKIIEEESALLNKTQKELIEESQKILNKYKKRNE
jgi:hypothetical protein